MANVFKPDFDAHQERPGFASKRARIGWQAGTERLGASVYELPPGQATFPYHWHAGNEELLIVLAGHPSVRLPSGWRELEEGEVVSFRRGERGAHQVVNRSDQGARFLMLSEMNAPEVNVYPDTGKIGALTRAPGSRVTDEDEGLSEFFRSGDAVDYWSDEPPPHLGGEQS
ncbi:MAG TPA: cupin domain-containing protein [Solirubrobacterales bacterium]|nr:cupin domain-containing protein [Solirubrobacterales bacterium]